MFHFINECHEHFVESLSVIMEPDYGESSDDKTEDDLLFEARKYCQKVVEDYEAEIKTDTFFPHNILTNRITRLRKLLFKDLEQLLQDFTTLSISNRKEWLMSIIDEMLRTSINKHKTLGLSSPALCRDLINDMIDISSVHTDMLSKIPLSNITLIDQAVRDINIHVRNVIRTIQIINTNQGQDCLKILFDNKLDNALSHINATYAQIDDVISVKQITSKTSKNGKPNKIKAKRSISDVAVNEDEEDENGNSDVNVKMADEKESSPIQVVEKPLKSRKLKK